MSQMRRYRNVLAGLLPAGAFGLSSALAATPAAEHQTPIATPPAQIAGIGGAPADVAGQLKAIREAVSALAGEDKTTGEQKVAWWWFRNYWPNFRNYWPNWGNYWRNW